MESKTSLYQLARNAGFDDKNARIAVAVALAESGGNANAHNGKPPDNSYGLWQINMIGAMGPARRKQFGIKSNSELFKPSVNARAAYMIWRQAGRSWSPWSTYKHGTYKRFMSGTSSLSMQTPDDPKASDPTMQPVGPSGDGQSDGSTGEVNGLTRGFNQFTEMLRRGIITWWLVLLAIVLIILGVYLINHKEINAAVGKVAKLAATKGMSS